MRQRRGSIIFALVLVIGLLAAAQAYAASTERVGGSLNRDGTLVKFTTKRYHAVGTVTYYIDNNTATYTRLGLRNTAGSQFTDSLQFDGVNYSQGFRLAGGGSYTIPAQYFYINGRMGSTWFLGDNTFSGMLTY